MTLKFNEFENILQVRNQRVSEKMLEKKQLEKQLHELNNKFKDAEEEGNDIKQITKQRREIINDLQDVEASLKVHELPASTLDARARQKEINLKLGNINKNLIKEIRADNLARQQELKIEYNNQIDEINVIKKEYLIKITALGKIYDESMGLQRELQKVAEYVPNAPDYSSQAIQPDIHPRNHEGVIYLKYEDIGKAFGDSIRNL